MLGLLALAIGTMIRHTAGAISTIIGIVFVLPILSGLLPSSWGAHINAYLPEQAGTLITHTQEQSGDLLSPWQGFGVLCIWTVLALAVAAYLLSAATPEASRAPRGAGRLADSWHHAKGVKRLVSGVISAEMPLIQGKELVGVVAFGQDGVHRVGYPDLHFLVPGDRLSGRAKVIDVGIGGAHYAPLVR